MAGTVLDPEGSQGSEFLNAVGGADGLDGYEHDEEVDRAYQNTLYNPRSPPATINPRDLMLHPPPEEPSHIEDEGAPGLGDPEEDVPTCCQMQDDPVHYEDDGIPPGSPMRHPSPWVPGTPESNLADNSMDIDTPAQQQRSPTLDAAEPPVSPDVSQPEDQVIGASSVEEHVNDPSGPLGVVVVEDGAFACQFEGCPRRFDTATQRKNHMKRCPIGRTPRHECGECHKWYFYPKDVVRCQQKHAGATVSCPDCGKTYSRLDNMKRHRCSNGSAGPSSRPARAARARSRRVSSAARSTAGAARQTRPVMARMPAVGHALATLEHATPQATRSTGVYTETPDPNVVTPSTDARRQSSAFSRHQYSTPITEPDADELLLDPRLRSKNPTSEGQLNASPPWQ